jgi:hypothetical protein
LDLVARHLDLAAFTSPAAAWIWNAACRHSASAIEALYKSPPPLPTPPPILTTPTIEGRVDGRERRGEEGRDVARGKRARGEGCRRLGWERTAGDRAGRKKQHNEKERRCRVRERARAARGR